MQDPRRAGKIPGGAPVLQYDISLMMTGSPRRLADIRNDFERGVFLSVYYSRQQRWRRFTARLILGVKHGLRGVAFSWTLYLLPLAAVVLNLTWLPVILLLLLPGIYVSGLILLRGVREDYGNLVDGTLLFSGYPGRLLLPGGFRR